MLSTVRLCGGSCRGTASISFSLSLSLSRRPRDNMLPIPPRVWTVPRTALIVGVVVQKVGPDWSPWSAQCGTHSNRAHLQSSSCVLVWEFSEQQQGQPTWNSWWILSWRLVSSRVNINDRFTTKQHSMT